MNPKIKSIGIFPDETVHIIKSIGGHSMRYDKQIFFLDNMEKIEEDILCATVDNNQAYLAVEIRGKNYELIKRIVKHYESKD